MVINLPPAVPRPCNDCPWRTNAAPGWLGPHDAETWLRYVHGEVPIACHQTIPDGSDGNTAEDIWSQDGIRQCKGAALYRKNVAKMPRNRTDAEHAIDVDDPQLELVFETDQQFLEHHG